MLVVENSDLCVFVAHFRKKRGTIEYWSRAFHTMTMYTIVCDESTATFRWSLASRVENFFRLQKIDASSDLDMNGWFTCASRILICILLFVGGFCDLSISLSRNGIGIIEAITYQNLNQIISIDHRKRRLATWSDPILRIFFCRPKIFFQKFSTRPTRQGLHDTIPTLFRTFHWKSIQNRCYGETEHIRYRRSIGELPKKWEFALFVKEKGRKGCKNIRQRWKEV